MPLSLFSVRRRLPETLSFLLYHTRAPGQAKIRQFFRPVRAWILLREKNSDGLEYTDETIITLVKNYKEYKEGVFDLSPKVIDAEASDDGSVLRVLCSFNGNTMLYNLNLDKKEWRDKNSLYRFPAILCSSGGHVDYSPGRVKQAYFLAPDIVFVSTDKGMEYAQKLCLYEGVVEYGPEKKIVKRQYCANLFYKGVYWNRVGPEELLNVRWRLKKDTMPDGTPIYGTWRLKDDADLPDTPPVPTDKDWEGWHKPERN